MIDQAAQMRLVPQLLRVAVQAGVAIREVYAHGRLETEHKADNSPLTVADLRAHQIIEAGLQLLTPQIPILSEEGTHLPFEQRRSWEELWVVDPLDGTKEFIKHSDEFTVNIALVQHQEPVLGVIHAPVTGETWLGIAAPRRPADRAPVPGPSRSQPSGGQNRAWKLVVRDEDDIGPEFSPESDARPIRARPAPPDPALAEVTVMVSRSHMNAETAAALEKAEREFARVRTTNIGSSLKLCKVAEGEVDLYPRNAPTCEWDTAAGHAIVRAAGGEIWQAGPELEPETRPLEYNKRNLLNPWFLVRAWQP